MSNGFCYYISGRTQPAQAKRDELLAWGLGYAFDGDLTHRPLLASGPDGQHGIVVADARVKEVGYFKDRQTWRQIPPALLSEDAPPIFVGYVPSDPPGPQDLARKHQLAGHWLQLASGEDKWLIPAAVQIDPDSAPDLPQWHGNVPLQSRLGEDGKWTASAVQPDYEQLWHVACAFFDRWYASKPAEGMIRFDFDGLHEGAVAALAANYRIGPVECDLLNLLSEDIAIDCLQAVIDRPNVLAWLQKKSASAPAGSASSPGAAD